MSDHKPWQIMPVSSIHKEIAFWVDECSGCAQEASIALDTAQRVGAIEFINVNCGADYDGYLEEIVAGIAADEPFYVACVDGDEWVVLPPDKLDVFARWCEANVTWW